MSLSAPLTVLPAMVTAIINARVPPAFRTQALAIYPPGNNPTEAKASYVNILSDAQFTSTSRRTAQCVSLNQTEPVWRYFFTHKHTIPQLEAFGSYHGMELFYVFNTWENATLGKGGLFKPADDSVQKVMLDYWVNFAKSGNPNNTGLELWPQYQSSNDCYLEIKATPNGKQCGLRTTESDFWDDVAGFTACKSTLGMHEIKNTETLLIYPNPSNSIIHVDCKNGFQIVNSLGQLVKNGSEPCSQINISDLPAGIYFLKIDKHTGSFIKAD
jgi:para-nitrobenzyl esterase